MSTNGGGRTEGRHEQTDGGGVDKLKERGVVKGGENSEIPAPACSIGPAIRTLARSHAPTCSACTCRHVRLLNHEGSLVNSE